MEKLNEFPETEQECLDTHICGCGTVADLMAQARKIVEDMMADNTHGCLIWNAYLVQMVEQVFMNQFMLLQMRQHGGAQGNILTKVLGNNINEDMQHIWRVCNENFKTQIIEMSKEKDGVTEEETSDGHTQH